jgi:hypothetical protein
MFTIWGDVSTRPQHSRDEKSVESPDSITVVVAPGPDFLARDGRSLNMPASVSAPSAAVLALQQSPIPALRKLRVEETEQGVVISGSVSSYYLKQLAQETVMPVLERRELINSVEVVSSSADMEV